MNNIAVIKIQGIISNGDMFFWGGTNISELSAEIEKAVNDEQIKGIILSINSVGGDVDGVPELAEYIAESRKIKPIIAYISYIGASAGYWLAAAAEKVYLHESASVGSIGVMAEFYGGGNETVIVSSVSPLKNQDPSTPDGLATLQRQIDELGYIFVNNIAKFRNTTVEDVLSNYGKGDILISYNALKAGMIDGISNFHQVKADFINLVGGEKKMSILSKFKAQNEDVKPTQEEKTPQEEETLNASNIDIEWLKKNKSEIVRQLQEEGAASERERIKSLCDTEESMPEEDKKEGKALFNSAKFEKPRAGVEVLGELFINKQRKFSEMRENYLKDSEKIPPIRDAAVADNAIKAEKDQLLNYALDYLKKKMGVK